MKKQANNLSGEGKTINILCATDDKYAPYCGVMLTSFLENHKAFHTEVYIIVKNRLKEEKRLKRLEQRYDVKVNIVEFPFSDITSSFPIVNRHWTIETYYRLFASELLPKDIDRVLYLDCDIIVDGDVSDIYFSDLDGISAFVAYDIPERMTQSHCVRLGYPKEYGYFNAGMMMLNLNFWREHDIKKRCVDYITEHHDILTLYDQDVLNYVLQDSKKYVSVLYNFQENTLQKYNYDVYSPAMKKEVDTCRPKIIHFTTPAKPWSFSRIRDLSTNFGTDTRTFHCGGTYQTSCRKRNRSIISSNAIFYGRSAYIFQSQGLSVQSGFNRQFPVQLIYIFNFRKMITCDKLAS